MLQVFDTQSGSLVAAPEVLEPVGWIHAEPCDEDLERLVAMGVPRDLPRHLQDPNEIARLDHSGQARLLVLRVPRPPATAGAPYSTAPLGIVILGPLVVTVAGRDSAVIRALAAQGNVVLGRPQRFVLEVMMCVAEDFLSHVHAIDTAVDALEDELQASLRNQEVLVLLQYQKSLTHFTTALASNQITLERLRKDARFALEERDQELLEDALVEIRQAIEMTSISANILSQMMDAFASIISNNLNSVMKVLTSLTIVLSIPVIVASFYGMNVSLPFQHHERAFELTLLASLVVVGVVARIFWKRRWL